MNFSQADTVAKNLNLEFQKTLILDVCSASILHFERNSQVIDCEAEAFTVKITPCPTKCGSNLAPKTYGAVESEYNKRWVTSSRISYQ
jgi:hypothetical protein